jgi:hypothetical protein
MHKRLLVSRCSLLGIVLLAGATACSNSPNGAPSSSGGQAGSGASAQGGSAASAQGGSAASAQGGSAASAQGGSAASAQGGSDGGCKADASTGSYVLIDDMETTDHGPIEFTVGISSPLSPGYWYNSGANYAPSGGSGGAGGGGGAGAGGNAVIDTSTPPQGSFTFTALPKPTATLDCKKTSEHAAHQYCVLNGQYDTCGVGFEFAQQPAASAGGAGAGGTGGADAGGTGAGGAGGIAAGAGGTAAGSGGASAGGAGGAAAGSTAAGGAAGSGGTGAGGAGGAASVPMTTVPFDISHYKAVTFWGMTTTPDSLTGSLRVKIQFPDTDTDPRGEVCNGAGPNTSKCYNSYAAYFEFTTNWQQFTVLLDAGQDAMPPTNGIAIDPTWGYQGAKWLPNAVYGINWQAQKDTAPDAGPPLTTDIWIDDVYFVE